MIYSIKWTQDSKVIFLYQR